jgi:hypothetical protein
MSQKENHIMVHIIIIVDMDIQVIMVQIGIKNMIEVEVIHEVHMRKRQKRRKKRKMIDSHKKQNIQDNSLRLERIESYKLKKILY